MTFNLNFSDDAHLWPCQCLSI